MKTGALFVLLVAVVGLPLSSYLLVDVPNGMENPWRARSILTFLKFIGAMGDCLEPWLGADYHVDAIRWLIRSAHTYLPEPPLPPGIQVANTTFSDVPVLVYTPSDLTPGGPGVIYLHGGGWVFGTVVHDRIPIRLAVELKAVVVAVEYRLAPEHVFPAALEDCEAATIYFTNHAVEYKVDPNRIIVAGDSAGGNLASAVALSLRNQAFSPQPAAQILVYPALQPLDFHTPSFRRHFKHPVIRGHLMPSCWLWYAVGHARDKQHLIDNKHTSPEIKSQTRATIMRLDILPEGYVPVGYKASPVEDGSREKWQELKAIFTNPLFSPMMADDLSGLPAALVVTVEHDVLRDEGAWYAHRLAEAGVVTHYKHYLHSFHGILSFDRLKESHIVLDDIVAFIKEHV